MLPKVATRAPRITLGTDKVRGLDCINYIQRGLAAGYRKIDTAQVYENEEEIGRAIRGSGIPRAQVLVTTKIAAGFKKNPSSWQEATYSAQRSLGRLGLEYIDTFLIHHPGDDAADPSAADRRRITWQALEEQVEKGYVKNIGVSNFNASHILEMRHYARIKPTIHQLEFHPWCQQRKLVDSCKQEEIQIQAYSAIARNVHCEDYELRAMAQRYQMSPAQLLLVYSLQKGYMPIVRATSLEHLHANLKAECITILEQDMSILDTWDEGAQGSLCTSVRHDIF